MSVAVAVESSPVQRDDAASPVRSRVGRIEVFHDLAAIEAAWRSLERECATPYQTYDLLAAWQRHVGAADGVRPMLVLASDRDGAPLMLLPLGVAHRRGVSVARFLGGKHTSFNMPLMQAAFAATGGREAMGDMIAHLRAQPDRPDLLALERQPQAWRGVANPLLALPHQPCVNPCPVAIATAGSSLTACASASMRRRLKHKERRLNKIAPTRYLCAVDDADIIRLLDAFFRLKPLRMAAQRLPNVFAEPGVEAFIREACRARRPNGQPAIQIHALESDDEIIAVFAGVADGRRFSMMFNTYTLSEAARFSPGLILIRDIIDHYARLKFDVFDLGVGGDDYKRLFCKGDEPLFDGFIGLTPRGVAAAAAAAALATVKRSVKQSPLLKKIALAARGALVARAD